METGGAPDSMIGIIRRTLCELRSREGVIIASVFLLLIIWGPKGIPLFTPLLQDWINNDPTHTSLRLQLVSFLGGFILLVIIPVILIRFGFKQSLRDYGFGLGNIRLGMALFFVSLVIWLPLMYVASLRADMWNEYPMIYRGMSTEQIKLVFQWRTFIGYELIYSTFFLAVEFIFRGYMLLGLRERFGAYAVLIQMLPYTIWHLPKPAPELLSTPIWGFFAGALGLRIRSVWYAFAIHWLLNVALDTIILAHRGVLSFS